MEFLTNSENIENLFKKHFQKQTVLYLNGDEYKRGKLILTKNSILGNNFYFEFVLEKPTKIENVKIPYPFSYEEYEDGLVYFDYRLCVLFKNNIAFEKLAKAWVDEQDQSTNKLFDNILEMHFS